jgi:hypothetical protein
VPVLFSHSVGTMLILRNCPARGLRPSQWTKQPIDPAMLKKLPFRTTPVLRLCEFHYSTEPLWSPTLRASEAGADFYWAMLRHLMRCRGVLPAAPQGVYRPRALRCY